MIQQPGMIVLLVQAYPADSEQPNALLYHNAAITCARIVRSRGRQLLVHADPASLLAIIAACAESYSVQRVTPEAQESFPAVRFAQDTSRYRGSDFEEEARDEFQPSSWSVLMGWASAERVEERELEAYIREAPRQLIIALGRPDYIMSRVEVLGLWDRAGSNLFVEDRTQLPFINSEVWDVRSVLGHEPNAERQAEREERDENTEIRQAAEREARLRFAMEWAVDRFLEERR